MTRTFRPVITQSDVTPLLHEACPSFESSPDWAMALEDDADKPLLFLLAAQFVRHLAALEVAGERDEYAAVFDLIERMVAEGDDHVENLATVGFLEDLQNGNMHPPGSSPEAFVPYMRPRSLWWWGELNRSWSGKLAGPLGSSGRPKPWEDERRVEGEIAIREMTTDDWPAVRDIYSAGIASGKATFEVQPPQWDEFDAASRPDL